MDISKDVRALLRTVAKDFAEAEGIIAGHVHFLAALNHLSGSIRQEFDRIVTGGLFQGEPEVAPADAEPEVQPIPVEEPVSAPAPVETPAVAEPVVVEPVIEESAPAAEPASEPKA